MANRCFDSPNNLFTAQDYTRQQKQKSIFSAILNNQTIFDTANPVKLNNKQYNDNVSLLTATSSESSSESSSWYCVNAAKSYDVLNDYLNGLQLLQPQQPTTVKYESWAGNLYSVDYVKHNVTSVVSNTMADWSDVVTDPSYSLFYEDCFFEFDQLNRPESWLKVVDISFNETIYYKQATNTFVPPCVTEATSDPSAPFLFFYYQRENDWAILLGPFQPTGILPYTPNIQYTNNQSQLMSSIGGRITLNIFYTQDYVSNTFVSFQLLIEDQIINLTSVPTAELNSLGPPDTNILYNFDFDTLNVTMPATNGNIQIQISLENNNNNTFLVAGNLSGPEYYDDVKLVYFE
jgi:hypothetical protein